MQIEDKLLDTLHILKMIENQVTHMNNGLNYLVNEHKIPELKKKNNEDVIFLIDHCMYSTIFYIQIWYVSFWDEFDRYFNSINHRDLIKEIRNSIKENRRLVDSLFPDLKGKRNTILAHGYRDMKGNKLSFDLINKRVIEITNHNIEDYFKLSESIILTMNKIEEKFGEIDVEN